jgi:hypothetical protein
MKLWDTASNFWILTTKELDQLPDGAVLATIDDDKFVKGVDTLDESRLLGITGYTTIGTNNPRTSIHKEFYFIFMLNS